METLLHFNDFINEILRDNSRTYKLSVLTKYKDDEIVKTYLRFIFDPYIITGISDKKLKKEFSMFELDSASESKSVFELLDYLKLNSTGRDSDILECQCFKQNILAQYNTEGKNLDLLLDKIITKNLQLGVDVLSINKCIPNLCRTFSVQLANKYFEKPETVIGKNFSLTTKIDGGRIIALKENGVVKFYTRAGQPYEGLVDLEAEMSSFMPDNLCLDGEITLLDKGILTSKDQYKQTMMITRKDGEKHGVKMLVFDCMTAEEFKNQKCNTPYAERRNMLSDIFNYLVERGDDLNPLNPTWHEYKYFNLLPILYQGSDVAEITKWLNYNVAHGEEGVMININDACYQFKRTNDLLKVKLMKDLDLKIVSYEEGTNSNAGKLGAFIVDYKGNKVKVGSGYSKEFREEVWKHPDDYIGMTISVQYFEETKNQQGGISLRFPVFLDLRYDK